MHKICHGIKLLNRARIQSNKMTTLKDPNFHFFFVCLFVSFEFFIGHIKTLFLSPLFFSFVYSLCDRYDPQTKALGCILQTKI